MSIPAAVKKVRVALALLEREMKTPKKPVGRKRKADTSHDVNALDGTLYFDVADMVETFMHEEDIELPKDAHELMAAENAFVHWLASGFSKAVGRSVRVNNEGYDATGNLVCKISINAGELPKILDFVQRNDGTINDGIVYDPNTSYLYAAGWMFFVDGNVNGTRIDWSDLLDLVD